jgi:putative ABC transport system permease protein
MIFEPLMLFKIIGLTVFIGVFAGIFPALRLSSLSPLRLIKEEITDSGRGRKSGSLKNILVTFQYIITIIALVSTFTVFSQLRFIKNNDPGFTHENVLTIAIKDPAIRKNPFFLINEFISNPKIADVSSSSYLPHNISSSGFGLWEGKPDELQAAVFRIGVDTKFVDFYDLAIVSGRGFSKDFRDDSLNNYIINQTAARMLGKDDAAGMRFGFQDNMGSVIGVVRNFNFQSLNLQIEPLAISVMPNEEFSEIQYISVKVNTGDLSEIKIFIENKLKEHSPGYLNPVSVLRDSIDRQYSSDRRLASIILFSTVLTLLLTCLGQYSLSFYSAQKRIREMAIRKVYGAEPAVIMSLFIGELIKLILVAVLIAWPVSLLVMNKWLQHYAFRTDIGPAELIYSLLITLFISLGVISYHVIRLSRVNPAEIIRYE